jgi:voltage-gated potassium channel
MTLMTRTRMQLILDGDDPVYGRAAAFVIQTLIILSAVAIAVETMPQLPQAARQALGIFEIVVLTAFTVEYVVRLWAAPNRLRYATSFYGIIDLLSILPSILLIGYELQALRALRLIRVLRLFKLVRYVAAFERLARAFRSVLDELLVFAGLAAIVLYLCASAIYWFEHTAQPEAFASIPHAMWWAIVTLTTVGYGDVYPVTAGGRIFTGIMLLVALGIIAVPTGLVASALSSERVAHAQEEADKKRQAERDG